MHLVRKLRSKIATSVSKIEETDTFLWQKPIRGVAVEYQEIDLFYPELSNTDFISLSINIQDKTSTFKFRLNKIKIMMLSSQRLKLKTKTNPVFFGFGNHSVSNININFSQDRKQFFTAKISKDNKLLSSKSSIDSTQAYTSSLQKAEINFIDYKINEPNIIDYLSQLKPEIYNIELLSPLEHPGTINSSNTKVNLLEVEPQLLNFDNNQLKFKEELLYSAFKFNPHINTGELNQYSELFPWNTSQVKIKIPEFNNKSQLNISVFYNHNSILSQQIKDSVSKTELSERIDKIIQLRKELSSTAEKIFFERLYPFQVEGVKFLASNKKVLFSNEPALGKTVQAIFAVKYLLIKREIKSALIIVDDNSIGDTGFSRRIGNSHGWLNKLTKFAPELSCNYITSESTDINAELLKNNQLTIISYPLLNKLLSEHYLKNGSVKKFDTLIFDDAEYFQKYRDNFSRLINIISPKFNWIITNLEKDIYSENVPPELNLKSYLSHNYDKARESLPKIIESDYWVKLDKKQQEDYNMALLIAKTSLQNIQATGNPFRFQSQLFLSLHQLSQIYNFSTDAIDSNKSKLLLSHINCIRSHDKQVIIFSQYDKHGIQKLIKLFDREKISYKKYSQRMNQGEVLKSISEFERDSSITVFLADTQAMKSKPLLVYAPYIIHFDQWWVPVLKWKLENIIKNNFNRPVTILNYFTKNTLDEKIQSILFKKTLLDRKKSENIGADTFTKSLNEDEWTSIFEFEKGSNSTTEIADGNDNNEEKN